LKKRILTLVGVLALVAALAIPMAALAIAGSNEATQSASTAPATSIEVRAQDYTTAVSTITFPSGAPGSTISNPYNDLAEAQTFGAAGTAKPVVTLVNTAPVPYKICYNISTFTNSVVTGENYLVLPKGVGCASAGDISNTVAFDADTITGFTIAETGNTSENDKKDFYLKVELNTTGGQTGISTLTILGEA